MDLGFTDGQRGLQRELRAYFEALVTEIEGSAQGEPTYTHYIRRMGQDGWLGLDRRSSTGARPAAPSTR